MLHVLINNYKMSQQTRVPTSQKTIQKKGNSLICLEPRREKLLLDFHQKLAGNLFIREIVGWPLECMVFSIYSYLFSNFAWWFKSCGVTKYQQWYFLDLLITFDYVIEYKWIYISNSSNRDNSKYIFIGMAIF